VCEGNVAKSGTTVDAKAATEHTRNKEEPRRQCNSINEVVSMNPRKNIYTLVKKKESSETYTGTNAYQ